MFDFCLGRGREGPKDFLGQFEGILQTDGYSAYEKVGGPKLVHAGCWAHSRRKFFDAVKLNPDDAVSTRIVMRIDELFAIDALARAEKLDHAARHVLRLERAQPLVEIIRREVEALVTPPCLRVRWERRRATRSCNGRSSRASWNTRSWS